MKLSATAVTALLICDLTDAFVAPQVKRGGSSLSMVLEMPKQKKLQKIETLKIDSDYLRHPLVEVRCRTFMSKQPSFSFGVITSSIKCGAFASGKSE
jgi:hypothetical protein